MWCNVEGDVSVCHLSAITDMNLTELGRLSVSDHWHESDRTGSAKVISSVVLRQPVPLFSCAAVVTQHCETSVLLIHYSRASPPSFSSVRPVCCWSITQGLHLRRSAVWDQCVVDPLLKGFTSVVQHCETSVLLIHYSRASPPSSDGWISFNSG